MSPAAAVQSPYHVVRGLRFAAAPAPWHLLLQLLLCTAPAMALVYRGNPPYAARYLVVSLMLVLGYHAAMRHRYEFTALAMGALPMVLLLRGVFFYYNVLASLGGAFLLFLMEEPDSIKRLWKD